MEGKTGKAMLAIGGRIGIGHSIALGVFASVVSATQVDFVASLVCGSDELVFLRFLVMLSSFE
jgi:hypothetical protein